MKNIERIGFMQGRLSPIRDGRIQSFPWETWKREFEQAKKIQFNNLEWTIDSENFFENPLVIKDGLQEIKRLSEKFEIRIPSVTCDYFMENPSWKSDSKIVHRNICMILDGMAVVGAQILVIPLVDNSTIGSQSELTSAKSFFESLTDELRDKKLQIAFESDFQPKELNEFLADFSPSEYGVNYDIGNSASSGFDPEEELSIYGARVLNVHVKDRLLGGSTVPLGEGAADFKTIFWMLRKHNYCGNFILQTARSKSEKHEEVLVKYQEMVVSWLEGTDDDSK